MSSIEQNENKFLFRYCSMLKRQLVLRYRTDRKSVHDNSLQSTSPFSFIYNLQHDFDRLTTIVILNYK